MGKAAATTNITTNQQQSNDAAPKSVPCKATETDLFDLLDISGDEQTESDCLLDIFGSAACGGKSSANTSNSTPSTSSAFDILKRLQGTSNASDSSSKKSAANRPKTDKPNSTWMELFADLDPLANPTSMEKKIAGPNSNCLDA